MIRLCLILFYVPFLISCENEDALFPVNNDPEILSCDYGLETPVLYENDFFIDRGTYNLNFNLDTLNPEWVAYELKREHIEGVKKKRKSFELDPDIPGGPTYDDYTGSGLDRGHMVPAADTSYSDEALVESFYMGNVSPQEPGLNRGAWRYLESHLRKLVLTSYENIYVAMGPLYEGSPEYIPKTNIRIPTSFYKVGLVVSKDKVTAFGLIIPQLPTGTDFKKYIVSVDEVEKVSGHDFFSCLSDKIEDSVEANTDFTDWL